MADLVRASFVQEFVSMSGIYFTALEKLESRIPITHPTVQYRERCKEAGATWNKPWSFWMNP